MWKGCLQSFDLSLTTMRVPKKNNIILQGQGHNKKRHLDISKYIGSLFLLKLTEILWAFYRLFCIHTYKVSVHANFDLLLLQALLYDKSLAWKWNRKKISIFLPKRLYGNYLVMLKYIVMHCTVSMYCKKKNVGTWGILPHYLRKFLFFQYTKKNYVA